MGVLVSEAGLEQVVGDHIIATIAWEQVRTIEATCSDHMTQRVAMLSVTSDADTIDIGEGERGWDELIEALPRCGPLAVADLASAVSLLRTGEVVTLLRR